MFVVTLRCFVLYFELKRSSSGDGSERYLVTWPREICCKKEYARNWAPQTMSRERLLNIEHVGVCITAHFIIIIDIVCCCCCCCSLTFIGSPLSELEACELETGIQWHDSELARRWLARGKEGRTRYFSQSWDVDVKTRLVDQLCALTRKILTVYLPVI